MYDCKKFLKCITAFSQFNPWVRKIAWRREWLPTPVSLPREFHGQRSLAGYRPQGQKESDATERLTQPLILTKKLTKASPDPLLTLLVWESWKLTPQALVSFPLPPPTASSLLPLTLQGEDKSGVLTWKQCSTSRFNFAFLNEISSISWTLFPPKCPAVMKVFLIASCVLSIFFTSLIFITPSSSSTSHATRQLMVCLG